MSGNVAPHIVTDGLTLYLDALNPSSYPGSGTTWYDLSSTKNDGTLIASPTYDGSSFTFNGSTQYAGNFVTQISDTGSKSISVFVNPVNTTTSMGVCGTYAGTAAGWGLLLNYSGTGEFIYFHGGGTTYGFSNVVTAGNQWYHLAATYNKTTSTAILYKNGVQIGAADTAVTAMGVGGNTGRVGADTRLLSGKLSNIQIYNRALSSTEILQNFNALKSRFGL